MTAVLDTLWDVAATLLLFAAPGSIGALLAIACDDLTRAPNH